MTNKINLDAIIGKQIIAKPYGGIPPIKTEGRILTFETTTGRIVGYHHDGGSVVIWAIEKETGRFYNVRQDARSIVII